MAIYRHLILYSRSNSSDRLWAKLRSSKHLVINCGFTYFLFTLIVALYYTAFSCGEEIQVDNRPFDQSVLEEIFDRHNHTIRLLTPD